MCHVTEVFEYNGRLEGIEQGKLEGKLEGSINTATSNVYNLINSLNWSLEKAIETLKIDDFIKEEVIKQVKLKLCK